MLRRVGLLRLSGLPPVPFARSGLAWVRVPKTSHDLAFPNRSKSFFRSRIPGYLRKVPARRINEIVHGKRAISADTALRLSRYFGMSDRFWINLQGRYDIEMEKDLAS